MKIGQVALHFGADDMGSIMLEENVVSAAGTTYRASTEDFCRLIRAAGYKPVQRDTLYRRVRDDVLRRLDPSPPTPGYLLFIWAPTGYRLEERTGETPAVGELVELGELGRQEVQKVGPSPLPGRRAALRVPDGGAVTVLVTLSITQSVVDFVTETIGDHGVPAVFLLMILESACIPVPSEVIQLFAGYLVSQDQMGLVAAILAGTLGNVARLVDRLGHRRVGAAGALSSASASTCTSRRSGWTWPTAGSSATATRSCSGRGCCRSSARSSRCRRASPGCRSAGSRSTRSSAALPVVHGADAARGEGGRELGDVGGPPQVLDYLVAVALIAGAVYLVRKWRRPAPA